MTEPIGTTGGSTNSDIITLADLKRFHIMLKEYYDKTNSILYNIAGLTYLPEFINAYCAGDTKRLLGLFIEQYIRLCYNHVMKRDK